MAVKKACTAPSISTHTIHCRTPCFFIGQAANNRQQIKQKAKKKKKSNKEFEGEAKREGREANRIE
jgi:hypothetical protein